MTQDLRRIGIIGAGSWGSALAVTFAASGRRIDLWARSPELAARINDDGRNDDYLPQVRFPAGIVATTEPQDLADVDALLIAAPAQALRDVLVRFDGVWQRPLPGIVCAKGIEEPTGRFMSDVLAQACPRLSPFVLSGPSFAADVASGLPVAVTLAGASLAEASALAQALSHSHFRIYSSDDMRGVEIGGAAKNVLAIACGIAEGKALGESARAALVTRAFAELARFGRALDARPETLTGLSGLGDLMLTCSSLKSRNYSLGYQLAQGETLQDVLAARRTVAEGVATAAAISQIAHDRSIELPICEAVQAIVTGRSDPDREIKRLLERPIRSETE